MSADETQQFLRGALSAACLVVSLFFARYYRQSRDRIFIFFVIAFVCLGAHWVGLAIVNPQAETRHYLFVIRLLAFVAIIAGVLDKNRRSRSG
jgi:Fe2+ transport system protein B